MKSLNANTVLWFWKYHSLLSHRYNFVLNFINCAWSTVSLTLCFVLISLGLFLLMCHIAAHSHIHICALLYKYITNTNTKSLTHTHLHPAQQIHGNTHHVQNSALAIFPRATLRYFDALQKPYFVRVWCHISRQNCHPHTIAIQALCHLFAGITAVFDRHWPNVQMSFV